MILTWKQRGSRVLGAYVLGFGSGLSISLLDQTLPVLTIFNCIVGGLITALPQVREVLDDYGKTGR